MGPACPPADLCSCQYAVGCITSYRCWTESPQQIPPIAPNSPKVDASSHLGTEEITRTLQNSNRVVISEALIPPNTRSVGRFEHSNQTTATKMRHWFDTVQTTSRNACLNGRSHRLDTQTGTSSIRRGGLAQPRCRPGTSECDWDNVNCREDSSTPRSTTLLVLFNPEVDSCKPNS